jgi:hypothetical protein
MERIFTQMDFIVDYKEIIDNGGTRSGRDRRKLKVINYYPERRTSQERRNGVDRRRRQISRGKLAIERREKFRGSRLHNQKI